LGANGSERMTSAAETDFEWMADVW